MKVAELLLLCTAFLQFFVQLHALGDSLRLGATKVLSYGVNMTIASRFARTHILVDIVNQRNCSTKEGFTFQLPLNARVTKLEMSITTSDCKMSGVVKAEEQAQQEFIASASQGRPSALLQAYDTTNYGVQISLLPNGHTVLEITLEQLLQRKRGQIDFQAPLYPGLPVNQLTFDIFIDEPHSGISKFGFEIDPENVDLGALQIIQDGTNSPVAMATLAVFNAAPIPVVMPQPRRHTFSRGASLLILAREISGTTLYSEKVEVPM